MKIKLQHKLFFIYVIVFIPIVGILLYSDIEDSKSLERYIIASMQKVGDTVHRSTRLSSEQKSIPFRDPEIVNEPRGEPRGIVIQQMIKLPEGKNRPSHIYYEIRVPILKEDKYMGTARSTFSLEEFQQLNRKSLIKHMGVAALCLFAGFAIVYLLIRRFNRPLAELSVASEKVAGGDYSIRLEPKDEDDVGRLTRSFNWMTEKMDENKRMETRIQELERRSILSEITSGIAHEVRNPLNLINLTADHLMTQFEPENPEKRSGYQEFIHSLKAQVGHLNKMVESLILMGRPPKIETSVFELSGLMNQIHTLLRHKMESQKIDFKYEEDVPIRFRGDAERMRLVMLNLILNAIQAIPKDGTGFIRVHVSRGLENKGLEIRVSDSGKGIAADLMERIFDPYFTTRPDGIGLGLALCRRIVEEHDGKISASNPETGGAEFILRFPEERTVL